MINTRSTMIYTEMRKGIIPEMYALSTLLFLIAFLLLLVMNFASSGKQAGVITKKAKERR